MPDEQKSAHFRELAKKSHAARRAKKQRRSPHEILKEAAEQVLAEDAKEVIRGLLRTPAGADRVLEVLEDAGLLAKQKPTLIVVQSAFAPPVVLKVQAWLRLLDAGDLEQLREELKAHSEDAAA